VHSSWQEGNIGVQPGQVIRSKSSIQGGRFKVTSEKVSAPDVWALIPTIEKSSEFFRKHAVLSRVFFAGQA
jgi:hypothetical protein